MRRFLCSLAVVGLSLAWLLRSTNACATPEEDAKDLFTRGRELRGIKRCDEALPLFRKALTLFPNGLGSLRNIAECEQDLGHFASSRRAWIDLKRALVTNHDAKYTGWSGEADEAARKLAPKVARLTIEIVVIDERGVPLSVKDANVRVQINGEPLAPELFGTMLERDPGSFRVHATAPLAASEKDQTLLLSAGDERRVVLQLVQKPALAPPSASHTEAPPRAAASVIDRAPASWPRTAGIVAFGVSGAALVGAGVALAVRGAAIDELESSCPGYASGPCDPSLRSTVSRGQTASTLATVLAVVGGAGLVGGAALFFLSPKKEAAFAVRPRVGSTNGVDATWSFH